MAWAISFAFLLVGFLSFLFLQNVEESFGEKDGVVSREPDYYLESMTRTTTSETGDLKNILRSNLVEHYPDDDSMELSAPHFEIYGKDPQPWHVISERAWVGSGNEIILLKGKVDIWKYGVGGEKLYEIHTSEVKVLPKERYAETDKPAKIIGPSSVTDTVGLKVIFSEGRVELTERVRSTYENF